MQHIVTSSLLTLLLGGGLLSCSALHQASSTPAVASTHVASAPTLTYRRALDTASAMGVQVTTTDAPRLFQGTLHNALTLNIHIAEAGEGSTLTVSALLLPNKVVLGALTEHQDFVTRYQSAYGGSHATHTQR